MHITDINDKSNRLLDCERKIDTLTKSLSLLIDRVNFLQGKVTDSQLAQPEPYYREIIFAFQELKKTIEVTLPQTLTSHLLEVLENRLDDIRDECLHINQLSSQEIRKEQEGIKHQVQPGRITMIRGSRQYTSATDKDEFVEREIKLWNQIKKDDPEFHQVVSNLPYDDVVKELSMDRLIMLKYYLDGYGHRRIATFTGFSETAIEYFLYNFFPSHLNIRGREQITRWWQTKVNQVLRDK
jgi:hypothetical protein